MGRLHDILFGVLLGVTLVMTINDIPKKIPEVETNPIETVTITWHQEIESQRWYSLTAKGFAYPNLETGECTIHAKKPLSRYDEKRMEILGHEVFHCFVGQFHE